MQIRSLTIGAQRKLPHPSVEFAHISGMANITANLSPDDDLAECIENLQTLADAAVEAHMEATNNRLKQQPRRVLSVKAAAATANTSAKLAEKHGGAF